jgi:hypothetical protein
MFGHYVRFIPFSFSPILRIDVSSRMPVVLLKIFFNLYYLTLRKFQTNATGVSVRQLMGLIKGTYIGNSNVSPMRGYDFFSLPVYDYIIFVSVRTPAWNAS